MATYPVSVLPTTADVRAIYRQCGQNITGWAEPNAYLGPRFMRILSSRVPEETIPWRSVPLEVALVWDQDRRAIDYMLVRRSDNNSGWTVRVPENLATADGMRDRNVLYNIAWPEGEMAILPTTDDDDASHLTVGKAGNATAIHIDLHGTSKLPAAFAHQVQRQIRLYMCQRKHAHQGPFAIDPRVRIQRPGNVAGPYEYWHTRQRFSTREFYRSLRSSLCTYKQFRPELCDQEFQFECQLNLLSGNRSVNVRKRLHFRKSDFNLVDPAK